MTVATPVPMAPSDHVAIVGAGFSGTLLAINLLRYDGPRVTLVERRGEQVARGVAYSAAEAGQLLNVRAGGMSAFPDDAGHFTRWLEARGEGGSQAFVPRELYGSYLREALAEVRRGREGRLAVVEAAAVDVAVARAGATVEMADGHRLTADTVVLATGNLPPHPPPGIVPEALPASCYVADPWRAALADGLGDGDTVVLLGTGLTAVDAALQLEAGGFAGTILALSRRGLAPRRHRDGLPPVETRADLPDATLSALVRRTRAAAQEGGWRAAVDAWRPVTQRLWAASDRTTRARFLRHLRPYWDVHRHRLAPVVAERIDAMAAAGRLRFAAGKVAACTADADGVILHWRPRGGDETIVTRAARLVNCTGPQGDLTRTDDPLLAALQRRGVIRPDPLRLGVDVDAQSRVIGRDGMPDPRLCCVGPMTRGGLWEVVAVPDLRRQTWDLARRLANAHWVGGEGL